MTRPNAVRAPHPMRTPDPAAMAALVADRPITADPFRPSAPDFSSPAVRAARQSLGRPRMSSDIRFALLRHPTDPDCKPVRFDQLAELAAFIHRERGGGALQAFDAPIFVMGEDEPRAGVSLFVVHIGDSADYLGWAYLDGRGVAALRAALNDAKPDAPVVGRKAA